MILSSVCVQLIGGIDPIRNGGVCLSILVLCISLISASRIHAEIETPPMPVEIQILQRSSILNETPCAHFWFPEGWLFFPSPEIIAGY
jgi:hypothetical protein